STSISTTSLSTVSNGRTSCTNGYNHNSVCTTTCNSGYRRVGSSSTKCQSNKRWTVSQARCQVVTCSGPSSTRNGYISCTNRYYYYNTVCTTRCYSGFRRVGSSSSRCQSNGYWTASQAACQPVSCSSLSTTRNGRTSCTNGYVYNSACTTTCSLGYRRVGSSSIRCLSNMRWTASQPTCELVSCSSLSTTQNGRTSCTNGYHYNSVCTTICNSGYKRVGSYSIRCQISTRWTASRATCQPVSCSILSTTRNGRTSCTNGYVYNSAC
ncbi:unnamed protein product, partial [Owenia fusiformis]